MVQIERRSNNPGRRELDRDKGECVFHDGMCSQLKHLWEKSESISGKAEARLLREKLDLKLDKVEGKEMKNDIKEKLDKFTFWKLTAIVSTLALIMVSILGWLLLETYQSNSRGVLLMANQAKMMEHFELTPIDDIEKVNSMLNGPNNLKTNKKNGAEK